MEKRSSLPLILCLTIVLIMALLGYIHIKRQSVNKLAKEIESVETALRESNLGLENYYLELQKTELDIDNAGKNIKELTDEIGKLTSANEVMNKEVTACKDSVAGLNNDVAAVEKEKSDINGNFLGEKTKWSEEMNRLKQQIQEHSPVCAHAKISSQDLEKDPTLKDLCPQIQKTAVNDAVLPLGKV
ncbi:uncharacterized protein si:ch73-347e22.8 [Pimephales promelas]|uniref:uncharacterized protein si:ch73-347e22.8 n=1 Tax=Pimephales promelas TaxID=90988 RepID=UPI001955F17A|nr:uncharacterized protein si:ch73-347e22.8 [Pimephales promelas]KAG1948695.1 hypothetical protein F2P79_012306 [Pimephales promelas]